MPQMLPLNWMILYFYFLIIYMIFIIINYTYNYYIANNLKPQNIFLNKSLTWKW
uniref:ATP synthase complex subunit 8 n=1 Tax=Beraeodes minutus TaxID=425955 RepID=A0A7D6ZUF0_9NEOP|nr:ATP synthase F0 subunit 8 [Beraeodes minutus]